MRTQPLISLTGLDRCWRLLFVVRCAVPFYGRASRTVPLALGARGLHPTRELMGYLQEADQPENWKARHYFLTTAACTAESVVLRQKATASSLGSWFWETARAGSSLPHQGPFRGRAVSVVIPGSATETGPQPREEGWLPHKHSRRSCAFFETKHPPLVQMGRRETCGSRSFFEALIKQRRSANPQSTRAPARGLVWLRSQSTQLHFSNAACRTTPYFWTSICSLLRQPSQFYVVFVFMECTCKLVPSLLRQQITSRYLRQQVFIDPRREARTDALQPACLWADILQYPTDNSRESDRCSSIPAVVSKETDRFSSGIPLSSPGRRTRTRRFYSHIVLRYL